jgi:hypothetical protein
MREFMQGTLVRVVDCDQVGCVIARNGRNRYSVALPLLGAVTDLRAEDMCPLDDEQGHALSSMLLAIQLDALDYLESFPPTGCSTDVRPRV